MMNNGGEKMNAGNDVKMEMRHISKWFPGVKALNDISFKVKKASTTVLCGENGAGKSTLMKIIDGIYQPSAGEIYVDGKKVVISNPIQARKLGISMIFQELSYVADLTVAENIFLGNWPMTNKVKINWAAIKIKTQELLEKENLPYSYNTKLRSLSVSDIQMIEILKAISQNSDLIIMDEPTSALTDREVERLFQKITQLKDRGVSIIYISHKMDEVFQIAEEITVLRDGNVIDTKKVNEIDINGVIELMVGRKIENQFPKVNVEIGKVLLEVEHFCRAGLFEDINFNVKAGEIVGFAGLMGAGRTEIMRALFGLDPYDSGIIKIKGEKVKIRNTKDSISHAMVMVSEDRKRFGIIPVRSVMENVSLASLKKFFYKGRLHKKEELSAVTDICKNMRVKAPSIRTKIVNLSGGNQQKVILAKWMLCNPEILILDEPTRGIDIGAKSEIFQLMSSFVKQGKGIVIVSSELPELIGVCDRIYVINQGRITGMIRRNDFTQMAIMKLAVNNNGE
jgi:inositol transport system ATP-binding protein